MTDQERQKAEELISALEVSVGQIFPRDGGNAALLATSILALKYPQFRTALEEYRRRQTQTVLDHPDPRV